MQRVRQNCSDTQSPRGPFSGPWVLSAQLCERHPFQTRANGQHCGQRPPPRHVSEEASFWTKRLSTVPAVRCGARQHAAWTRLWNGNRPASPGSRPACRLAQAAEEARWLRTAKPRTSR